MNFSDIGPVTQARGEKSITGVLMGMRECEITDENGKQRQDMIILLLRDCLYIFCIENKFKTNGGDAEPVREAMLPQLGNFEGRSEGR